MTISFANIINIIRGNLVGLLITIVSFPINVVVMAFYTLTSTRKSTIISSIIGTLLLTVLVFMYQTGSVYYLDSHVQKFVYAPDGDVSIIAVDDLQKIPEEEMQSLQTCSSIFAAAPHNTALLEEKLHLVHTCRPYDIFCKNVPINISLCASHHPTFLQNLIKISEKPCYYLGKESYVNASEEKQKNQLYCYDSLTSRNALWNALAPLVEKTLSVINVVEGDILHHQIAVARLDNDISKNKSSASKELAKFHKK